MLQIWNFATYQEERILSGHARDVLSCDWHHSLVRLDVASFNPISNLKPIIDNKTLIKSRRRKETQAYTPAVRLGTKV